MPERAWVQNCYAKTAAETYGRPDGTDMIKCLKKNIENFNEQEGTRCASFAQMNDDNFVVVIQTKLMKRICDWIPLSKEVLYVDSSGTMDRFGCRVLLLMTNSCAGGLPVSVFVTSNETENTIRKTISLLKNDFLNEDSSF